MRCDVSYSSNDNDKDKDNDKNVVVDDGWEDTPTTTLIITLPSYLIQILL